LLGTIFNRLDTSIPVPRICNNQRPSKLHLVPPPPSTVSSRTPTDQHRQSFLESSFPSTYLVPSTSAISAAASSNEKELDREQKSDEILEAKLSIPNTIIKFTLDQTIGAAVNTLLFSLVFAGFRGADMAQATQIAKQDFWGLMSAGWKLWPLVSAINFTLVKSVQTRNLVGSLAGMGWNVYLSLVAGES
jgi:protein Mpv17